MPKFNRTELVKYLERKIPEFQVVRWEIRGNGHWRLYFSSGNKVGNISCNNSGRDLDERYRKNVMRDARKSLQTVKV